MSRNHNEDPAPREVWKSLAISRRALPGVWVGVSIGGYAGDPPGALREMQPLQTPTSCCRVQCLLGSAPSQMPSETIPHMNLQSDKRWTQLTVRSVM